MASSSLLKDLFCKRVPVNRGALFIDRWAGRRDYKFSQMSTTLEGCITTPWINAKYENLSEYESRIYNKVLHATEDIAINIAEKSEELERIEYVTPATTCDSESDERLAARIIARNEHNKEREKEIRMLLATLKSELEMIDAALKEHMQRAESATNKHIYSYLGGVARAAGEDGLKDFSSRPEVFHRSIQGKAIYEEHYNRMMACLEKVLEGRRNNNEDDQESA